jgi:hypothetical protein
MSQHTFVTLSADQRRQLETLVRTGQHKARVLNRARMLLLLDRSQETKSTDKQIAELLDCHWLTVFNTRKRFLAEGLDGVLTEKPMGSTAPKKITGALEAQIALLACSDAPDGHAQWTLRLLANKVVELGYTDYISHVTIGETLKKTKSSPGKSEPGASPSRRQNT